MVDPVHSKKVEAAASVSSDLSKTLDFLKLLKERSRAADAADMGDSNFRSIDS